MTSDAARAAAESVSAFAAPVSAAVRVSILPQVLVWSAAAHAGKVRIFGQSRTISEPGDCGLSFDLSPAAAMRLGQMIYRAGKALASLDDESEPASPAPTADAPDSPPDPPRQP